MSMIGFYRGFFPVTKKLVFCFGIFSAEGKTKITGAITVADTPAMVVSVPLPGMMYEEPQNVT